MDKDIAGIVYRLRKEAEKLASADQRAYVQRSLAEWPWILKKIKSHPLASLSWALLFLYIVFCGVVAMNLFVRHVALTYLLFLDLLAIPFCFMAMQIIDSWGTERASIFRWQRFAFHLRAGAAREKLSDSELVQGLNALAESHRVEEHFILGVSAALAAAWGISEKLYGNNNPLPDVIRSISFIPSAKNYVYLLIGYGLLVCGYGLRYYVPRQWDKQLRVFLRDPKEK
jgi:hypothetical protein